MLTECDRRSWQ